MSTKTQIVRRLQEIIENESGTIKEFVCKEAIQEDEPIAFFQDLMTHGCVSGMVTSLIYYVDTHKFYDNFYDEIEELRTEYLSESGEPIRVDGDWKNTMAWFAFEEVARTIANELDIPL